MAAVSARWMVGVNRPAGPVRTESIGPPPPRICTWCSTTQVCASGRPLGPYTTCPDTCTPCAIPSRPPPPPHRQRRTSTLRRELAEIFRIEVLEVRLESVRVERRGTGRIAGCLSRVHGGDGQEGLARVDRRLEAQSDRDRVRRPRVDLDDGVAAVDVELGVVGVVLHLSDDHFAQIGAEA